MPIISISLSEDLLRRLEQFAKSMGYSSRSEVIRDAVRSMLSEFELSRFEGGRVTATITVISAHERHEVDEKLMRLRHEYDEIVSTNMHIHLGETYCLEVFVAEGEIEKILSFIGRIRAMKDIHEVKYTVIPLPERS